MFNGKRTIYEQAGDWLTDEAAPLRVLDTETTGLEDTAQIIEIAVVDAGGNVLLNSLVRPTVAITREAKAVHGLSIADVMDAPTLADLWPQIRDTLRGTRVVAYNAEFDRRLLYQSAAAHELKRFACQWACAMELYAAKTAYGRYVSLDRACAACGVPRAGHRALGDALAALGVLRSLAVMAGRPGLIATAPYAEFPAEGWEE